MTKSIRENIYRKASKEINGLNYNFRNDDEISGEDSDNKEEEKDQDLEEAILKIFPDENFICLGDFRSSKSSKK